jgi:hypothetical protein
LAPSLIKGNFIKMPDDAALADMRRILSPDIGKDPKARWSALVAGFRDTPDLDWCLSSDNGEHEDMHPKFRRAMNEAVVALRYLYVVHHDDWKPPTDRAELGRVRRAYNKHRRVLKRGIQWSKKNRLAFDHGVWRLNDERIFGFNDAHLSLAHAIRDCDPAVLPRVRWCLLGEIIDTIDSTKSLPTIEEEVNGSGFESPVLSILARLNPKFLCPHINLSADDWKALAGLGPYIQRWRSRGGFRIHPTEFHAWYPNLLSDGGEFDRPPGRMYLLVAGEHSWETVELPGDLQLWQLLISWHLSPPDSREYWMLRSLQMCWLGHERVLQPKTSELKGLELLNSILDNGVDHRIGVVSLLIGGKSGAWYQIRPEWKWDVDLSVYSFADVDKALFSEWQYKDGKSICVEVLDSEKNLPKLDYVAVMALALSDDLNTAKQVDTLAMSIRRYNSKLMYEILEDDGECEWTPEPGELLELVDELDQVDEDELELPPSRRWDSLMYTISSILSRLKRAWGRRNNPWDRFWGV